MSRHAKPYRKLSRQRSHYRALMRNLALGLFQNERIETTVEKAKEVRRFVDKLITLGKKGGLAHRRRAVALFGNIVARTPGGKRIDVIGEKLFGEFAKRYATRPGGFTRIIRIGNRPGDAADMAILELIGAQVKVAKKGKDESEAPVAKEAAPKKEKKASASKKAKAA